MSVRPSSAGRSLGVVVEQLVEVAHAEEQQHAGMAVLGLPVLLHHGGVVACHNLSVPKNLRRIIYEPQYIWVVGGSREVRWSALLA